MSCRVVFSPKAEKQLVSLYSYIDLLFPYNKDGIFAD